MLQKGLKNLIILLLAPLGALLLFYLSRDVSGLSASVLDIMEMQRIQENGRNLAYKNTDQLFEIFLGDGLQKADQISVQVLFDPQKLSYDADSFSGKLLQRKEKESWLLWLQIWLSQDHQKELPIFAMAFSGAEEKILLGEAKAIIEGWEQPLSVGNLNIKEDIF